MEHKITTVLEAISDDISLELFKLIALTDGSSESLRANLNVTRKQYYSRLSKITRCGLVKKQDNRYILTTLGNITFEAQEAIQRALQSYWKIKAGDSLDVPGNLPRDDPRRQIETLIEDQGLQNISAKS